MWCPHFRDNLLSFDFLIYTVCLVFCLCILIKYILPLPVTANKQAEPELPQQPEESQEPKYIEDAPPPPSKFQLTGPPPTAGLTQPSRVPIATQGGVSQSSAAHQQSVPSTAHSQQGNSFDTRYNIYII